MLNFFFVTGFKTISLQFSVAKHDSGKLHCPVTTLIHDEIDIGTQDLVTTYHIDSWKEFFSDSSRAICQLP